MGEVVTEGVISSLEALVAMYQLVASLYKHPPARELLEYFKHIELDDEEDPFLQDEECRTGIGLMSRFCQQLELEEVIHRTTGDHSQLFVGPLHLPSPPWSSVYMDRGSLFGPTTFAVEKEFKRLGFSIPEGNHEPCDHIAYELQFVAELNKKAAERLGQGDKAGGLEYVSEARHFSSSYLAPWLSDFLGLVEKHAETDFYRGLAKLTRGLARMESEFLNAVAHQMTDDIDRP